MFFYKSRLLAKSERMVSIKKRVKRKIITRGDMKKRHLMNKIRQRQNSLNFQKKINNETWTSFNRSNYTVNVNQR